MNLPELDESAFRPLIEHLSKHNIPINKYRQKVGIGRSQCFGLVRKRSLSPDLSRCSWLDAKLHHLLIKFGLLNLPEGFTYTSIQVNDSFLCKTHKDKHNVGQSYIVGFGNYTGGELVLKQPDDTLYNIRHRPVLFNGSETEHYTKEFEGRRWTLVYHTIVAPAKFPLLRKLSDYEAVALNGTYVIAWYREGEPTVYLSKHSGLPHPLKGRKKRKPEQVLEPQDPSLTPAQNLMLRAKRVQEPEASHSESLSDGE